MRKTKLTLSMVAAALVFAPSLAAQHWPMPSKKDVEPTALTRDGKATHPYSSPFADHTGRWVDSSETTDYLGNPRTFRGKGLYVNRSAGTVYAKLGERLASYQLSNFFTSKLGSPLSDSATRNASLTRPGGAELYLDYYDYVDPEDPSQRWSTYVLDGQTRLWDVAWDDRGYVFVAYDLWGFLILKDQSSQLQKVGQVDWNATSLGTVRVIESFKANGKYYLLISDGDGEAEIWDTSNAANPFVVRKIHAPIRSASATSNHIAIARAGYAHQQSWNDLKIYTNAAFVAGGAESFTLSGGSGDEVMSVDTDGISFYALVSATKGFSSSISILSWNGSSFNKKTFSVEGQARGLRYNDGHVTAWGTGSHRRVDGWLFRVSGQSLEERDLGDFIEGYYGGLKGANTGYMTFANDLLFIEHAGREYLAISTKGLADVFELEAPDRISIDLDAGAGFGTKNPNTPSSSSGPYYGDELTFRSTYAAGNTTITWNFGNPEAGSANTVSGSANGSVKHRYVGLTSSSQITSPKKVTAYENAKPSNTAETTVALKLPEARAILDSTGEAISQGDEVLLGDMFKDASDGSVQGHYSSWVIGGTTKDVAPTTGVSVGTCGASTMRLHAKYGPYTVSGGVATPSLAASQYYVDSTNNVSYEVKPFVARISASRSGDDITFTNDADVANWSVFSAGNATNWVETWKLLDANGAVILSDSQTTSVSSPGSFVVAASAMPSGGKVTLNISMDPSSINDAGCQTASAASSDAQMIVKGPDPVIQTTGCAVVGGPCELTAVSASGADLAEWEITWSRNGSFIGTGESISVSIGEPGTYTFAVSAKSIFGTGNDSVSKTVEGSACIGNVSPSALSVNYKGKSSGCSNSSCTTNETLEFFPSAWGYTFQECDQFSWNFGDGSSATGRHVEHKFSGNGPYTVKVTVTNPNGTATATTKVQFGSGGGGNPNPSCSAPNGIAAPSYNGQVSGCSANGGPCIANETIKFTGSAFQYTPQSCDTYRWTFGDGGSSTQRSPSYVYKQAGTYTATFTIQNSAGKISNTTTVRVESSNYDPNCKSAPPQPSIDYTGATSGCEPGSTGCLPNESISFEADFWQYNGQGCDQYLWDFGDGNTSTAEKPTHKFGPGEFLVTLTVSNKNGSASSSVTISTGPPAVKPSSASFTASPSRPKPGEPVTFTGSASGGDAPTSWSWDFGDGRTGSGKTVTHTYVGEGSFNVTLTASNSGGSAVYSRAMKVSDSVVFVLPLVAHINGANGSSWRTDVQIHVPFQDVAGVEIEASYKGINKTFLLDGSTEVFRDFLREMTDQDGAGPVTINSPVPLQIWTRLYNLNASGVGTFGQMIPAIDMEERSGSAGTPQILSLGSLRHDQDYRANLGFVNPNGEAVDVRVHVYDELGLEIDTFDVTISPTDFQQKSLSAWSSVDFSSGRYSLRVDNSAGLPLAVYASVVDNISNDPVYIEAVSDSELYNDSAQTQYLPGVGHLSTWRSDVTLFNPDTQTTQIRLRYLGTDGIEAGSQTVTIPAKAGVALEDVIGPDHIDADGTFGTLIVETLSPSATYPVVFNRTYSDQGALGTFGQGIPAFSTANVTKNRGAVIPGALNDTSFRTNLGLVSLSDQPTIVAIALLDPNTGQVRGLREHSLSPRGADIVPNIISDFLGSFADKGTIRIEVIQGGPVWAYGSIIDNLTSDPEYVPAVPVLE